MYKIKIEDTETGKVLVDEESNCIICVNYLPDENSAHCIAVVEQADGDTIYRVLKSTKDLCRNVKKQL